MSEPWPFPTNNRPRPILVGESVAELVIPRVADAALARVPPEGRAEFWHGFMAAATATMGAQVGFVAFEQIMQACIEYGRTMALSGRAAAQPRTMHGMFCLTPRLSF